MSFIRGTQAAFVLLSISLSAVAWGQSPPGDRADEHVLPDAPQAKALQEAPPPQTASLVSAARISGTVVDNAGGVVPGAQVRLAGSGNAQEQTTLADSGGEFTFSGLPLGDYRITVTAPGMRAYVSSEIRLSSSSGREVLKVTLSLTGAREDVRVEATQKEIATEQISLQEQQRVLGVLPNFYTSYIWNAAPLTPRLKLQLAVKSVTDPVSIAGAGALAGVQQAANSFPGYGQESMGYVKRAGAAYADDFIARMLGSAVFPTFLHQDPRYFYRGSGSISSRALYALSAAVICKGDDGHWQPNYSRVLGSLAAGGIANLYHPAGDRGVSLTFRNTLIDTAGNAGTNLLREFLLRKLTPKVPAYANGKP